MPFSGNFTVIINPCAGAGRGREYLEAIRSLTEQYGGRLQVSKSPGHAVYLARKCAEKHTPLVFAAGGDDTVREVLLGLPRNNAQRLGIIPVGTFNNFATSLGIPEDPISALQETLLGRSCMIDLGKVENGPYFIESVGIGLDSDAWSRAPKQEPIGMARWFTGIRVGFCALSAYLPKHLSITIDGKALDIHDVMQVIIANSRCFGARWQIAPRASLDDGLLDVCIVPLMSKAKFLSALPLFFYGKQLDYLPSLRYYQCRKITVRSKKPAQARVDGLLANTLPITIRAIAQALPMRLPASCFSGNALR